MDATVEHPQKRQILNVVLFALLSDVPSEAGSLLSKGANRRTTNPQLEAEGSGIVRMIGGNVLVQKQFKKYYQEPDWVEAFTTLQIE